MSCTVVVGGQYGSEGKGKVVSLLSRRLDRPWIVRCGGPNSGHTTVVDGHDLVVRQLPAGVSNPGATLLLSAGCALDERILVEEADRLGVPRERLIIDPRAVVISARDKVEEEPAMARIGSTGSGTGAALARRSRRDPSVCLAADSEAIVRRCRIERVAPLLHQRLDAGQDVVIEGTQGFGLSLLHGPFYPHVTARDTTASGFASEVGLAPRDVHQVVMVVRTFPIRVGGESGPLQDEITWDDVREVSGAPSAVPEFTSVTKKLRRVGRFDWAMLREAARYNQATAIAVMGLDRLLFADTHADSRENLSESGRGFLRRVEKETGAVVKYVGTGFGTDDAFMSEAGSAR